MLAHKRLVAGFLCLVSLAVPHFGSAREPVLPYSSQTGTNVSDEGEAWGDLVRLKRLTLEELMDQTVTTASRRPEPYRSAPAALVVISDDDIRRSGATSFPEALRLAENLHVAQSSSSSWQISARGFNNAVANKLLVLMDGRSIYSPLFSGVIWNMQDYLLEDIARIEVVSGPGGTLWGANAVNGVINIVSKDASLTQGVYAEAGGGSWLHGFVGVRYGGALSSNVHFRIYGKYFDRGAQVFRDNSDAHDSWDRGQGGFRIDAAYDQDHFTFQGDGFGGFNDVVPGGQGSPRAVGHSVGGNVLGRWTHTFNPDSQMSLQVYYDRTHLYAPFQGAGTIPPGAVRHKLDTYDIDFQHFFRWTERQRIVWGAGYRFTHDVTRSAPLVAFLPEKLDRNLFSGFLQDEIQLHEQLFLILGTKVEHNDYTGVEWEPSARLQWNVTDRHMLWSAVSRAVRMPSRFDRDLFQPHPSFGNLLGGNDSFRSETVIAYELGYRAQLSQRLSGSISTFFNDYDDIRTLSPTTSGDPPLTFQNNMEVNTYGFELGVNYQMLEWWRWHVGYTLLKEDIDLRGVDVSNGLGETADPQQQVLVRSSINLPHNIEFDAMFRWIDQVRNNSGPVVGVVPSYAELDLRLGWRPNENWEFSIVGRNLIHSRHPEAGYPGPSQEEIERSVYGKVAWRF